MKMKNADKLAHPEYSMSQNRDGDYSLSVDGGLTKREHFAGLAMQGFCVGGGNIEYIANASVRLADALLAKLEEGEK